jgi:hypothetical protein
MAYSNTGNLALGIQKNMHEFCLWAILEKHPVKWLLRYSTPPFAHTVVYQQCAVFF